MDTEAAPRRQAPAEEWANSASHALAFLLAAAAGPVWWQLSRDRGAPLLHSAAVSVFVLTAMALYAASAICHALPQGAAKAWFDRADRAAIYLFIAGSYTPFAAASLASGGTHGWWLLSAVWVAALAGTALSMCVPTLPVRWSMAAYLVMGWLVLLAALPVAGAGPGAVMVWLLAGGAAYSAGAVLFMASERLRFAHLGWHLMVMLGSLLHGVAVWHTG